MAEIIRSGTTDSDHRDKVNKLQGEIVYKNREIAKKEVKEGEQRENAYCLHCIKLHADKDMFDSEECKTAEFSKETDSEFVQNGLPYSEHAVVYICDSCDGSTSVTFTGRGNTK